MRVKVAVFIALALLASLGITQYVQAIPPDPHSFYGYVTINGKPAPIGTEVKVVGENVQTGVTGNPLVITVVGRYGGPEIGDPKLIVQGDIIPLTVLTFYVNGVSTGTTYQFQSGQVTRVDLSPTADITVTPSAVNFGSVLVGTSSSPQTLTIKNDGNANLVIGTITIGGAEANQFSKQSDNASGRTIAPGASVTLQVVFAPTSAGAKSATLTIPSDDPDENPVNVTLSGSGVVPDITVTPSAVNFGPVLVGTSSSPQTITIRNDGNANLVVGTITISGAEANQFSKQSDSASGQTIAPGASVTLQVVFAPTSAEAKSATLTIPSNDPDENPVNVTLSGSGNYESECFIATAAYGTATAEQIDILRNFRDKVLMRNRAGAMCVSFYYRVSPRIASFISQHEALRTAVREGFVEPLVAILRCSQSWWNR